ncbi:MAG: hypothetical protein AAF546_10380 [Verrucomicrobiota bacterium]
MNPMLMKVILISVALHALAGLVAGFITIANIVIPDDAQFDEAPKVAEEEPPKEVKVKLRPKPPSQENLRKPSIKPLGKIAVSQVAVDLPSMGDSFTISAGFGNFGGGSLLGSSRGNIGMGFSEVNVFGLKTKAERILFVVDVNREMVSDKKGGLNSFRVIKDEITNMVGNLNSGTLFNVLLHDRRDMMLFKPKLVSAGSDTHQELLKWIAPINSNAGRPGLEGNRAANKPELTALSEDPIQGYLSISGQANETGFITQFALEQGVDAIFMITGYHRGFEEMRRVLTPEERKEWEELRSSEAYKAQLAAHDKEVPSMQKRIKAALAKINAERAKKNQPPRVLGRRTGVRGQARELGLKWKNEHPGGSPNPKLSPKQIEDYYKKLVDTLYTTVGRPEPSINVVLFLAGDEEMKPEWEDSLNDYVRSFGGKKRIIRGLNEIKRAQTSAETQN